MAVVINTDSKSGATNIDKSRQETNGSNLDEGIRCWEKILTIDEGKFPVPGQVDFTGHPEEREFLEYVKQQVSKTIPSRIEKNFIHYGLSSPTEISWKEIKKMAKLYLSADPWLQITFCKDSTRQGVDEKVQREMLQQRVSRGVFVKERQGIYVYQGDIYNSKRELQTATSSANIDRKDIDTSGVINKKSIKIFQKYAKVGGGHQDNVFTETLHFVKDSEQYVHKHKDDIVFVAQIDGAWLEEQIPRLIDEINSERVFVGNSEQVIDWLNQIE
ncbi:MAG: hypothetical protein GWP25_06400 [Euryarchaeota archaeon]|nr:hypothetical protein [Euryarchaeota archaeon]